MPCFSAVALPAHIAWPALIAMSKPTFRPYPEPGAEVKGQFRLFRFLSETIRHGGFHFTTLMPHIIIPVYVAYMILKRMGLWTDGMDTFVEGLLIPALQGLAIGGIIGTTYLRFSLTGRKIKSKRDEGAATSEEDAGQHRVEVTFWAFIYLLVIT